MNKRTQFVNYGYKALRTAAKKLYYLRFDLQYKEAFEKKRLNIADGCRLDNQFFKEYKKKWLSWSESAIVSRKELECYCFFSGIKSIDYMPASVYFTTIDPILNDKQMAWGYSEKGHYSKLFGIDNEPVSFFRYINGLSYDFGGNVLISPGEFLNESLKSYSRILIKPITDSWGGRNILVFEKDKNDRWVCVNEEVDFSFKNLVRYYKKNFVVQEFLNQHPFYAKFNPSSFNTVRMYVYRSPLDEKPYVLHSVLKAGKPNSVVDNLKAGGMAFYIMPSGKLHNGITMDLERVNHLPDDPGALIQDLDSAAGIEEMKELSRSIALKLPFHRLISLDINIDIDGKPRLVELNLSESGNGVQLFGYPFLGKFTDEIIEFCKKQKKIDFLRV